jgi:ABC-type dipeptide/oligopeptide/nickel transport system ATPase subunit
VSKYSIWQTCQDRLGALEARRDSTIELLASSKKDVDILKDEIAKSSQLMDLAAKAGLQSISSTLDEINNRAKYWIDQLFDGEVTATLIPFKKLKSKDEVVDKISLDVYFNGTKLSDYNDDLSGGQRTRLRAAFNLAMCDLYNSPILILDEAFSGVDSNTIMDCLAAIHPISQRKLVLVIEHGSSGYEYDLVINIEEVI